MPGRRAGLTPTNRNWLVVGVAAAAGVVAAISDAAPTGTSGWDSVVTFAFAAALVVLLSLQAASIALVVATLTAVLASGGPWWIAGAVGLVLTALRVLVRSDSQLLAAGAAAFTVSAIFHWPTLGRWGIPSAVCAVVLLVLTIFVYRDLGPRHRRMARAALIIPVLLGGTVVALGGLELARAKADLDEAVVAGRAGVSAFRSGDIDDARAQFARADDLFRAADQHASASWTKPLLLVPGVAQNTRAAQVAVGQGAVLLSHAVELANSEVFESINSGEFEIDVGALSDLTPDLRETVAAVDTSVEALSATRSGWLVPQVDRGIDDFVTELRDVMPDLQTTMEAMEVAPALLGADSARHYFVAFGSPAESRELGGFIGSFALVKTENGRISVIDSGRIRETYPTTRANGAQVDDAPRHYLDAHRPSEWPQNMSGSPNINLVAATARDLLQGFQDVTIDGFIYLDSWAFVELMSLVGPVDVSWSGEPLSSANAADFIFDGQYRLDETRTETFAAVSEIFGQVLEALTNQDLGELREMVETLGDTARQGHLQIATFDEAENEFLQSVRLQRSFGWSEETTDAFAVVQSNAEASKLDLFLHRSISYRPSIDADGSLSATVDIELTLDIPADTPPYVAPDSVHRINLSLYSPHSLVSTSIEGVATEALRVSEDGFGRYSVQVPVVDGTPTSVQFVLEGRVDEVDGYTLAIWHQPLVNTDAVTVDVVAPVGVDTHSLALTEDTVYSLPVVSDGATD